MKSRSGKQCRERYINHLDPDMKRTAWTAEENNILRDKHAEFGTKWSKYMPLLPGRSDNCIKNHYHLISRNLDFRPSHERQVSCKRSMSDAFQSISDDAEDLDHNEIRLNKLVAARGKLDREIVKLEEHCFLTKQASSSSKSTSSANSDNTPGKQTEDDMFSEYKYNFSFSRSTDPIPAVEKESVKSVASDSETETEKFLERALRRT